MFSAAIEENVSLLRVEFAQVTPEQAGSPRDCNHPHPQSNAERGEEAKAGAGWMAKAQAWKGPPPCPPARLEAGPEGGLDAVPLAPVAGRGLGAGTPLGASLGGLGSQFGLFLEQGKAQKPRGASDCHPNQPDWLRAAAPRRWPFSPVRPWSVGKGSFKPAINAVNREPNVGGLGALSS